MFENLPLKEFFDALKTERAQVVILLLLIIFSAFFTIRYVALPQRDMARNNSAVREELENSRYAKASIDEMRAIVEQEVANLQHLSNAWAHVTARLNSFPEPDIQLEDEVNLIDYKSALYDMRQRLKVKSDELEIQLLPGDLGMDETITSSDAILVRMLQLRAVEKLADLALDRQIQRLVEIYPLAPVEHKDAKNRNTFVEYPVRVECDVDFEQLFTFFQSVFEENQVFTFRNVRIESGPTFDARLRVKAVLSALLFK